MKGINTILGALAAASLLFSVGENADENAKRDENGKVVRGAYETNGAFDNIFIGVAGGVNTVWEKGQGIGDIGVATDFNIGKWFTPAVGIRAGWHGLSNNAKRDATEIHAAGYNYFHGDFLWNISNSISGYKETRFWDFVPYVTTGILYVGENHEDGVKPALGSKANLEYAAGVGLLNVLRLSNRVDLTLDIACLAGRATAYNATPATGFHLLALPQATLGLSFNLGKTNFDRHSSITPVVIPVPFTTDQYNALKDKVAALEKENAELKDKVAALENELAPFRNLVDGQTYLYENGQFTAVEATIASPATLYFDCGSAKLSQRELAHLEYFAQNVVTADTQLLVTGSADKQTGSARRNQQLSEQRADYVKNLLVDKYGATADNIETVGEGATNNIFDTPAKNRVVTIKVK